MLLHSRILKQFITLPTSRREKQKTGCESCYALMFSIKNIALFWLLLLEMVMIALMMMMVLVLVLVIVECIEVIKKNT